MDNVCYPETLGKLLVINAPWIAVNSWGLVKSWLDPRTVNKIEILSAADSIKRMHELIDLDQIPPMYGGSGPDLYFPKPNTECVQVSARGEVVRYFDLVPHAEAVVDSYATEGPLECVVCVLTTAEAARFKALKTPVQKALASFNVPERRLLHRSELAPTTGVPIRRLLRHSSAELGTDKGEAKVLLAMWTNAARISSRNLVYTVTIEAPSSVGNG
jgi:CRAL/TRIO domain